eukprot:MONOS_8113.1-p1 / transcript=MONOS_8113.1 / gene=MONOS_8113 / organism=Monocercomonoides_exilis_PA203 / gene_product=unspecified product / transcript_product=unspecified product / location=Mono_scaffold00297:2069-10174(-) / protein_length=2330 / sequence_SO=supercontig / SO=protein_coding / is_pseudo=false
MLLRCKGRAGALLFASFSVSIIMRSIYCNEETSCKADAFKKADFQDYSIGRLGETHEASKNAPFPHRVDAINAAKSNAMQDFDSSGWSQNTEKSKKRLQEDSERAFDHNFLAGTLNNDMSKWSCVCSRMTVLNSSLAVEQINIIQKIASAISVRNELSRLSVSGCIISVETETESSAFECAGGTIRMANISFQRHFPQQAWPSLVSASPCSLPLTGHVHVLSCTFSSFCASLANPFIGDVDLSFASASFCSFHNTSVQSSTKHLKEKHSLQESKIEGCAVTDCVCPFYGVLISGSCGCGFGSSNTSFIRSKNTISHQNFTNRAQSFSEGEIKFEDCNFTECSAANGGAIFVSGSAKLTVGKCIFLGCYNTYNEHYGHGGAVFSDGSDCNIENSFFNNCRGTGEWTVGGAYTHLTNNFSIVIGCSFENCSAIYGGSVAWDEGASGSLFNSVFKNSRALVRYAGTVFLQEPRTDFEISNCYLLKGDTQRGAGGIDISFNDYNKNLKIQFCLFENNTVQRSMQGADIFIGPGFSLDDNTCQILQCLTLSTAQRKVVQCVEYAETCGDKGVVYDSCLPTPQSEIHIRTSGNNANTCGGTGSECQTVEYGVTRWNSYLGQNVFMASEEFEEDMIDVEWRKIVLSGAENNSSAIKCSEASSNDCLISIGNGSLNAKRISFVCVFNRSAIAIGSSGLLELELCSFAKSDQSTQPSIKSVIQVDEGSLTMKFVNVSGFGFSQGCAIALSDCKSVSLSNASFLNVESEQNGGCLNAVWSEGSENGCEASISGCIFEHCVVSGDGNGGGALFLSLPSTYSATISGCSFEECKAPFGSQEGFGGGIFLDLEHSDAGFAITAPSFSSEKPNKAKHGNDLFVQSPNLKESITSEKLPFACSLGHSSFDDLRGFNGNDREHSIPLVLFFEEVGSTIHVGSEDGADTVVCGFSDYPCQSVDYCMERLEEENAKAIRVIVSATIENEMMLHNVNLRSSDDLRAGITCTKSLNALTGKAMAATGNASIESIRFLLPSSFDAEIETLISLTSESNLSLTKCAFEMQQGEVNQIGYRLFQMSGGILKMDNCQIDSANLHHAPIAVSENTASTPTTIISLNVKNTNIGDQPLIGVIPSSTSKLLNEGTTSDKTVCLTQCTFSGIANGNADSAVLISSSISSHVECLHWNVTNAKGTQSMEGGAMKIVVEAQGQFVMENATFTKCCAENETGGNGGGIYFDCSASNAFSFQQITFDQCSAKHGKNMFFLSSDLNVSITKQTLAFEVSETASDTNLFVGNDTTKTNFDLCRFLIGFASQEIHLSKNSGWDVLRCGSGEEPCATMEYGQKHFRALEDPAQPSMNTFVIVDEAQVNSEMDISNVILTSADTGSCPTLTFGAAISPQNGNEEEGDCVLANDGKCSLMNIEVCCGDGSGWRQTKLISTAGSSFAAQGCSFTSVSSTAIHYCIIACLSGTCELSFCSFQSIQAESHILMVSHGSSIDLTNVSMSNMELMGKSIVSVLGQGKLQDEPLELNEDKGPTLQKVQILNAESKASLIAFSSDGSGDHSNIQCYHSDFDAISVLSGSLLSVECTDANVEMNFLAISNAKLREGCAVSVTSNASTFRLKQSSYQNITRESFGPCCLAASSSSSSLLVELENCTSHKCISSSDKGRIAALTDLADVNLSSCSFDGATGAQQFGVNEDSLNNLCRWNGSMVDLQNCSGLMKDSTLANSENGGLSLSGGSVEIEKGEFMNNNPSIANYGSARRNVLCGDSAKLKVMSLKGGDGVLPNTSLWILDKGCTLEGIAKERASAFFIPKVESVTSEKSGEKVDAVFRGSVLLPCNLSFKTVAAIGDEEVVEKYLFDASGFISEEEVHGSVPAKIIEGVPSEAEVRVCILFGKVNLPSATDSFILKNRSNSEPDGEGNLVEGGKEGKSWALIIAVIFIVLFLIVLIVSIVLAVRWRKQKRRTEELEIIVEDNIRKDPKLIEMVTMEMSPEEQWRRAEQEAEKKNEERIKKRMNGKEMVHSESEEYLLSESGSTEYILGKDSDKIPEWMLEKVDEKEEETRKRTPSPSISSTYLRDSLFMLLHGRNEKKEMAIGTLEEREQTAAQILFWVANGAIHSFDEMENELQSLSSLSSLVVLFSEHMVICIVLHFDCSSDDSDSSSISSCSIATSTSDCSRANRNGRGSPPPSSAFEEDDDDIKECLRWKAPELQMNKKMGATKKSVAFSIGMMLWECLTLEIPFGEYAAELAGQKIANGERPVHGAERDSSLFECVKSCLSQEAKDRPKLMELKREFIQRFPPGAVIVTISDAVDYECFSGCQRENEESKESDESGRSNSKTLLVNGK